MKKYLCFLLLSGVMMTLSSLEVIDTKGISHFYSNAELYKKETQEIKTTWHPIENIAGAGGGY